MRTIAALLVVTAAGCGEDRVPAIDAGAVIDSNPATTPRIMRVFWKPGPGCTQDVAHPYTITTTANDPDTEVSLLVIAGAVGGCNGSITGTPATITCANLMTMPGRVTVTDPEGNSALQGFTITPCAPGSVP